MGPLFVGPAISIALTVAVMALVLLLTGCASVCMVEFVVPPHMDCKKIGER